MRTILKKRTFHDNHHHNWTNVWMMIERSDARVHSFHAQILTHTPVCMHALQTYIHIIYIYMSLPGGNAAEFGELP